MRRLLPFLALLFLATVAGGQDKIPPAALGEVTKVERVYYLADGRKITVEEPLDGGKETPTEEAQPAKAAPPKPAATRPKAEAPVPLPAKADEPTPDSPVLIYMRDGSTMRGTYGQYLAMGGSPANVRPGVTVSPDVLESTRRLSAPVQTTLPAREVPVAQPFPVGRSGPRSPVANAVHAGHNCPSCGTAQYVIAGRNADGTHTHVCPRCQTAWRH